MMYSTPWCVRNWDVKSVLFWLQMGTKSRLNLFTVAGSDPRVRICDIWHELEFITQCELIQSIESYEEEYSERF